MQTRFLHTFSQQSPSEINTWAEPLITWNRYWFYHSLIAASRVFLISKSQGTSCPLPSPSSSAFGMMSEILFFDPKGELMISNNITTAAGTTIDEYAWMGIILGRLILDEIQVSLSIFTISPLVVAGYANRETIRRATVAYRPELESIFQKYEASERGCRGKDSFVGYASITTEIIIKRMDLSLSDFHWRVRGCFHDHIGRDCSRIITKVCPTTRCHLFL